MGVAAELLFSSDIQHQTDMHALQFLGAVLLGRGVTDTIKSGIVDQDSFRDTPDVFMYGMFCALMASALWLIVATMLELPVSTTHSIFGCGSQSLPSLACDYSVIRGGSHRMCCWV